MTRQAGVERMSPETGKLYRVLSCSLQQWAHQPSHVLQGASHDRSAAPLLRVKMLRVRQVAELQTAQSLRHIHSVQQHIEFEIDLKRPDIEITRTNEGDGIIDVMVFECKSPLVCK